MTASGTVNAAVLADELDDLARAAYEPGNRQARRCEQSTKWQTLAEFPFSASGYRCSQILRVSYLRQRNGMRVWGLRPCEVDIDGTVWPLKGIGFTVRADLLPHVGAAIAKALRMEVEDPFQSSPASHTGRESAEPRTSDDGSHGEP